MGQSQSTSSNKDNSGQDTERRVDYYELLGIERDASEDDIKKAYRKKALELHPDRNYGKVEAATKLFAEVQCAYEVLSDPQERAWYDSHQHAELSDDGQAAGQGQQPPSGGFKMTASNITSLVMNFNPHMEFSDSPSGFFGGLRDIFDQIATDEGIACRWEGSEPVDYPSFGGKHDSYDVVVRPFYAVWTSFSTKKSFAWKDKYKYGEAPDRRVRRLMEKENKKMREDGIREYNDAVRALVAFVKKRDPRYKINIQTEAERQRMLRESAAAQAARSRAANQAKMQDHVVPEWARTHEQAGEDVEHEGQFYSSSESEVEHFECVVCNKIFKSQKQFEAHERSKKHIKAVKQLRREMLLEDEELNLEGDEEPEVVKEEEFEGEAIPANGVPDDEGDIAEAQTKDKIKDTTMEPLTSRSPSPSSSEDEDQDYVDLGDMKPEKTSLSSDDSDDDDLKSKPTTAKLGKAKQKRAKKLAAQQASSTDTQSKCANCQATFPSRTQLFSHLRETGHAQPVATAQSKQKKGKKSRK
ncbi:C2H2 finger domain protein, putative [Talaromyces stipitatus ATCC 10500]|uniref:C2H2 finger domain protein, putative n=1 Tax=Talaromyces stipitatus (strain ATCC 10500 / CBS 375.48 / QM 6759 / NRRL 1006) TaxID=441959 RepID=B8MNS6_TALSN|nr:C2H2 finger domain protein, putative [Talaromyces stipitatus ATCC 10500]EED14165.1 C2H2 finger domain protein, putative [Talaromyces stipitatus ATCC 10500]